MTTRNLTRNPMPALMLALALSTASLQSLHAGQNNAAAALGVTSADSVANESGYLTLFIDNDLFAGTDSNYTNGVRISYITESKPVIDIPFVQKNLNRFSGDRESAEWMQRLWGFKNPEEIEYDYGFAITQLMFTPETREALTPPAGERPYAGWLGVGFSLHTRDSHALNSVEISFGVVGSHSYAQESQDFIHDLRNIEKFQGWDSQIPNEFTFNIAFNQRRRWELLDEKKLPFGLEIDGFQETGYALGNYITEAHVGAMLRMGWNLPVEFSDPRLTTTAHTQKIYSNENINSKPWSFFVLAGFRAGYILHDITIDGPVFRNYDTGIDREPWAGELYAGFGVRLKRWEIGYAQTYQTKRFKTQKEPQAFGSIVVRRRF